MGAGPARLDPDGEAKALSEVRNFPSIADLSRGKRLLGVAQALERPLYPWTFLLDERLNIPQGEAARDDDLHTIRVDQDSRMQSAIRASDPVRNGGHAAQVRDALGPRTSVYLPQIGEAGADKRIAASSFPLRRRPNLTHPDTDTQDEKEAGG
jgi:hypothetical protein